MHSKLTSSSARGLPGFKRAPTPKHSSCRPECFCMASVFVYGTLLEDRIAKGLLGRLPPHRLATLPNFARYKVKGAAFPAIVTESGSRVRGRVRLSLSAAACTRTAALHPQVRQSSVCPKICCTMEMLDARSSRLCMSKFCLRTLFCCQKLPAHSSEHSSAKNATFWTCRSVQWRARLRCKSHSSLHVGCTCITSRCNTRRTTSAWPADKRAL